nr:hypothetical protein Iba_chr02aCG9240 [Ipomoea batatas]
MEKKEIGKCELQAVLSQSNQPNIKLTLFPALKECSPPYIKHTIISILQQLRRRWTPNTGESSDVTAPDLRCFREGLPANLAASTVKKQGCRSKLQSISSNVNRRSRTSKKQSVGNDNRLR